MKSFELDQYSVMTKTQAIVLVKCGIAECGMRKVKCGIQNCGNGCGTVGKMRNAESVYGANMWESGARIRSIKWQLAYYLL